MSNRFYRGAISLLALASLGHTPALLASVQQDGLSKLQDAYSGTLSSECLSITALPPHTGAVGPAHPSTYVTWKVYHSGLDYLEVLSKPVRTKRDEVESYEAMTYVVHRHEDRQISGYLVEGCDLIGNHPRADLTVSLGSRIRTPARTFQQYSGLGFLKSQETSNSAPLWPNVTILDAGNIEGLSDLQGDEWITFARSLTGAEVPSLREAFSWKVGGDTNAGIPSEMVWHVLNADGSSHNRVHLVVDAASPQHLSAADGDAVLSIARSIDVDWGMTTIHADDPAAASGLKYITRSHEIETAWIALTGYSR